MRHAQDGAPNVLLHTAMDAGHYGTESNDPDRDALFIINSFHAARQL
jgi:protease II